MIKYSLAIPLLFLLVTCNSSIDEKTLTVKLNDKYPEWLVLNNYRPQQTSGITFLGKTNNGNKIFLIVDDIGKIHHLEIKDDKIVSISPVYLSSEIKEELKDFPKKDFEEIIYDKQTGKVYLSVEGNKPNPKKYMHIYQLHFLNDDVYSDTILKFTPLNVTPEDEFKKYVDNNISFEGAAVDNNYFYFGLEGFMEKDVFADSTIIYIVDKNSHQIKKEINTKPFGIKTICGLYSDKNYSLWGIDRNSKLLFHINFNEELNVEEVDTTGLKTHIPGYKNNNYVASLESITFDDEDKIYLIDDPWKSYFIPEEEILSKLDSTTINNFKKFTPIIYKYSIIK